MANDNDKLVIGLFPDEKAAKKAAKNLKEWDAFEEDKKIKLGAMAALTYNEKKDKLHADEIGQRSWKSGAGWGTAIGATIGILTGGIGLIPGMVVGAAAGSAVGGLNHKSVGLNDEQYAAIVDALKGGGAALAVMCDDYEVDPVVAQMKVEGADVSHYEVEEEVAEAVVAAAAAQEAASDAIDQTAEEVDEEEMAEAAAEVEAADLDIEEEHVEHVTKLVAVTGMSAEEAAKLHGDGVEKVSEFLALCATPEGRKEVSELTGVPEDEILAQAKKLDLMRVKGVGPKYANLLLAAGVDTVPELATRNPANLAAKCAEVNEEAQIVETVPSEDMVASWVAQAKELPRMLHY